MNDEGDVGDIHRETAAGWDVVAREKYGAEFDDHVAHLRAGGDNLLSEEHALLADLLPGARVIQLQCSHGLDALGLLNAGAASVVGVDLSAEMVAQARAKAEAVGAVAASFVVGDAADPPGELDDSADLVYTGRGSLCWLMALDPWARGVARLLRPGGSLVIYEGRFPRRVAERGAGPDTPRMPERHWRP
ncbi:MAG: class I SAM-dependent methyltransferase, partial [Longimicrobiales bacterium]